MALSGDKFVRVVMGHLGCSTPIELEEAMGWKRGTDRLIAKWLSNNNNPSYGRTMEMLEKAELVDLDIEPEPEVFATALLGRVLAVLQQEPELMRHHPDLLRGLAGELRAFAERLEAAAKAGRDDGTLPE